MSLRGCLVASMLLVFSVGLGGALTMRPLEQSATTFFLGNYGQVVLREPYQDLLVLIPFSIGAIALSWLVSGWSLRHLASASREAAAIGPTSPSSRISTRRLPGEVRPLVDAVNGALDRLADAYAGEQRFVADAAHELRTPLAVLNLHLQRAKLDGLLDWSGIDQDLAAVNRLAGQLLDLARKEHATQTNAGADRPVVNLSRIAREVAAALLPLIEKEGRPFKVELPTSLPLHGRSDDLRDMVRNLLDNALEHGDGLVSLTGRVAEDRVDGLQVWLTLSDEGRGIPADLGDTVFDRFRKGSPKTKGHGLGLAIVREVARGHNGRVHVLPGPGCQVRVILPLAGNLRNCGLRSRDPFPQERSNRSSNGFRNLSWYRELAPHCPGNLDIQQLRQRRHFGARLRKSGAITTTEGLTNSKEK